jgi:PAS domain S-box-containing protein
MANKLRKTGIDVLGDIPWGTHFCHFYQTKKDFVELLTAYFKAGLENNEYCLWAISNPFNLEKVMHSLKQSLPDFDEHIARKSFEIVPITESYLTNGKFNPKGIVDEWVQRLQNALERGYDGIRIHGNKGWLEEDDWENYQQYEKELGSVVCNHRMIVLCTYPLAKSDASTFLDIVHLHGRVVSTRKGKWKVLQEAEIDQIKAELQKENRELEMRVEQRTQELERTIRKLENEIAERRKVETQLLKEKELTNQIFNSIPAVVTLIDENFHYIRWNKEFEKNTPDTEDKTTIRVGDYARNEKVKQDTYKLIQEIFDKGSATGDIAPVYINNEERIFQITGHRITYEGKPCILCVGVDITERKKAENQLSDEKELSNQIIDSIPGLFGLFDENLRFVRWNKSFEIASGYTAQEITKLHVVESFYDNEEDKRRISFILNDILEKGSGSAEVSPRMKDGSPVTVFFSGRSFKYQGKTYLITTGIDISEQKRAEAQLSKEKELSNYIIDSIPALFALFDENLRFIRWNKNFETVSGYTPEEILKLHGVESFFDNEEDKKRTSRILAEIIEKGTGSAEVSPLMKDGNPVHLLFIGKSFKHEGRTYLITTGIDISERKRAEEKLNQHRRLLAEAEHLAHVGSWSLDLRTNKVTWSDEVYRIFGVNPSEFDPRLETVIEFSHPDDKDAVLKVVEEAIKTLEPYDFQYRMLRPDGEERILHVSGSVMADEEGKAVREYGAVQDVTERIKAEEAMKQYYKQIRSLTEHLQNVREEERTNIAREIHDELGQQLTVMKMDVAWLNNKLDLTDQNARKKIYGLLDLLDNTVQSVRRIASELRPSMLDDLGLAAAMEWHLSEFEKRSGIKTYFEEPDEEWELPRNKTTHLYRIFQESLTNVARHSNATEVKVKLANTDDHLSLTIEDNGRGFDQQEANEKKTLGILGMKERTSMMGGSCKIHSAPGKGTTVHIFLPLKS